MFGIPTFTNYWLCRMLSINRNCYLIGYDESSTRNTKYMCNKRQCKISFLYSYCRYLIPNSGPSIFNYVYHHVEGKTSNYVPIINSLLSRYIDEQNRDTGKIFYHCILMYSWWLGLAKALAKPTWKIVYSLMYYFMSAQIFRTVESLLTTGTCVFAFLLYNVNLRQPVACNSC